MEIHAKKAPVLRLCIVCKQRDNKSKTFFSLPKEKSRRTLWLRNCKMEDKFCDIPRGRAAYICIDHFAKDAVISARSRHARLKKDATPIDLTENNNADSWKTTTPLHRVKTPRWCVGCRSKPRGMSSYHQFPEDAELRGQWLKNLDLEHLLYVPNPPTHNQFLCNKHFADEDILKFPSHNIRRLRRGALPLDVRPNRPTYVLPTCEPEDSPKLSKSDNTLNSNEQDVDEEGRGESPSVVKKDKDEDLNIICQTVPSKKEVRRRMKQKLADYEALIDDLLEGSLVIKEGKKAIKRTRAKYNTTTVNLDVTESEQNTTKCSNFEKSERIQRKEERRRVRLKLADFETLIVDLLERKMAVKKGRKMIKRMVAKYETFD